VPSRSTLLKTGAPVDGLIPSKNPTPQAQAALVTPGTATYGTLRQRNPAYDGKMLEQLEDMYVGGYQIQAKAKQYMVQLDGETAVRMGERCRIASYTPWFSQIVDQFVSDLFSQHLAVMPAADADNPNTPGDVPDKKFYGDFQSNVDLRKNSFDDLMRACICGALKKKRALVQIDAPADGSPAPSKAVEDANGGGRLYAYEVPVEQLIDWKNDDQGQFVWAILHKREQEREGPLDVRGTTVETFLVWTMDGDVAAWTRYQIAWTDVAPNDNDLVKKLDDGRTSFKRIPLLCLELPPGLWVGNKIGPQSMEYWQRRASLLGAMNRSLVAVPYVKRGSEMGAPGGELPSETQQDPNRGANPVQSVRRKGYSEIGAGDEIGFAEPEGKCYTIVRDDLKDLKEAMFSVTFQMAASVTPSAGSLGRSGLSKVEDGKSTAKVLGALGGILRKFGCLVYATVSEARGEDVIWIGHGLDNYQVDDREVTLAEATVVDQIPIDSPTFKKTEKFQLAQKIARNLDPRTLAQIQDEIEDAVDAEKEISDLKRADTKDRLVNPEKYLPIVQAPPGPNAPPPQGPNVPPPKGPQLPGKGSPMGSAKPMSAKGKPGAKPFGKGGEPREVKIWDREDDDFLPPLDVGARE
jgi:hypothetical protein